MADVKVAIEEGRSGKPRPAYLLVGSETLLVERAITALRRATVGPGGVPGFNEDLFHGGSGLEGSTVVAAATTLPMMADTRFVLLRRVDQVRAAGQAELAAYLAKPSPSTCLVMTAEKIAGNTKLGRAAKKHGVRFDAKPLKGGALRGFIVDEAKGRGHPLAQEAAQALLDALGDDLAAIDDALERLSLYVGAGQRIDLEAVEACVTRVRVDSIWALVDAVSLRDARKASAAASSLLADRQAPLRILAMVARQLRMVARMREALASGARGEAAARQAGAPPFKARDLTEAARRFTLGDLGRAFDTLAETDLLLKGSKIPGDVALQRAVLELCLRPDAPREARR